MKALFICIFTLSLSFGVYPNEDKNANCEDLLDWIYKDFTLNNVDLSYKRLTQKLLISIYYANEFNQDKNKKKLNDALDRMKSIDEDFKPLLKTPQRYRYSPFWRMITGDHSIVELDPSTLSQAISEWRELQNKHPSYFEGMAEEFKLDKWDEQTIKILENLERYDFDNHNFEEELDSIAKELNKAKTKILSNTSFNSVNIESNIQNTNDEIVHALIDAFNSNLGKYSEVCSRKEMALFIQQNNLLCPIPPEDSGVLGLQKQLNSLQMIIENSNALQSKEPLRSDTPARANDVPSISITQLDYETSTSSKATYCLRPPEMVSMIVLHHTGVSSNPLEINNAHTNNPFNKEPWYMIGYNYIIENDFLQGTKKSPEVFQGRPINMKGAHAGGYTEVLTKNEIDRLSQYSIQCGNELVGFKTSTLAEQMNPRRQNSVSGNLLSIGIAVSGRFSPVKIRRVAGVAVPQSINRTNSSLPSSYEISKVAQLSCELQRKYPNIKKIVPHSYFKNTDCPAALMLYFEEIQAQTRALGCEFDISYRKDR